MPRLKFVQKLSEAIKRQLDEIYHNHADFAFSQRAHAILLSDKMLYPDAELFSLMRRRP